jgi:hypothetical protein
LIAKAWEIRNVMQWIADHWLGLATTALLAVIEFMGRSLAGRLQ